MAAKVQLCKMEPGQWENLCLAKLGYLVLIRKGGGLGLRSGLSGG